MMTFVTAVNCWGCTPLCSVCLCAAWRQPRTTNRFSAPIIFLELSGRFDLWQSAV